MSSTAQKPVKALLLSAYHAHSHAHWAAELTRLFADMQWTVLTMPPRYFRWRIRGNALSWVFSEQDVLLQDYDLLLATSMVDIVGLRGLLPKLATVPTVLYFHENQFAYPGSDDQDFSVTELQMLTLYSALAADALVFNSAYNRDSFLQGCEELLKKLPDHNPWQAVRKKLQQNNRVIPVPLSPGPTASVRHEQGERLQVLWNHRWEYDKGPGQLLAAVKAMQQRHLPVILHLVGQQFRRSPEEFSLIQQLLSKPGPVQLGHCGYLEARENYQQLLLEADVVLSTALHDFQGLSVLEAVAAGCLPLLPDRLCYPEWFGEGALYPSLPDKPEQEATGLVDRLVELCRLKQQGKLPRAPSVEVFQGPRLQKSYRSLFNSVLR